jgi:Phage integrase family
MMAAGAPAAVLAGVVPAAAAGAAQLPERFAPRSDVVSWPATQASRPQVLARLLAPPFTMDHPGTQRERRLALIRVACWLEAQPGGTWQDRWLASGAEGRPDWREAYATWRAGRAAQPPGGALPQLSPGLIVLISGDVIRPGIGWLLRHTPRNLGTEMARTRDGAGFARLAGLACSVQATAHTRHDALNRIAVIMAAKGGMVADITVGDCAQLLQAIAAGSAVTGRKNADGPFFYQLLHGVGVLGVDAPASARVLAGRGQPGCEQLIARYGISCAPVRELLVDYLRERQPAMDFASLDNLARQLGRQFWADLEDHHPGISSLKLPRDVAAAWKQRVMTRTGPAGEPAARLTGRGVLSAVRAFYLDIAEWADEDPARWGPHAVRCPVSASDASHKKDRAQRKSRMDQRTRERLPLLPALLAWAGTERAAATLRLHAAAAARPGEVFTADGQMLRRAVMKTGRTTGRIWATDPGGGKRRDLTYEEHRAFWAWALIEVLRHTGIRIEELSELTHHSLIQYRLPATGELIPLLQIAPSKTDEERLLVVSPELADVLSAIVSRIRDEHGAIPLAVFYDHYERVFYPPLPLLFQWRLRLENRPVSQGSLRKYLDHTLAASGLTGPGARSAHYSCHDFRRIFITDAITHGMPPHIAQLIAGHRDINTTMGYKAIYPEDVINGHRAFIARRRALRPAAEYRVPTDAEWDDFLGHFQRRKVALGDCGRSWDTACIHEHSCLRCPMLRPDPAQRPRLEAICANLADRITEAEQHHWLGEAEGLKVSLAGARHKLAQMDQISASRDTSTHLGMPAFPGIAGRAALQPAADHPKPPIH